MIAKSTIFKSIPFLYQSMSHQYFPDVKMSVVRAVIEKYVLFTLPQFNPVTVSSLNSVLDVKACFVVIWIYF